MFFASDNGGPAHPQVMNHVMAANQGHAMPYGNDASMQAVRDLVRDVLEAPQAEVFLVATGSAANAIALASYAQPYQTIYCSPLAHIAQDECGAPEFYAGGAKLTLVPGSDKMTPQALASSIAGTAQGVVHGVQRGPVSITNVTEAGRVYSVSEIEALSAVAQTHDLPVHLDGARFANALVATNASPAEMSWQAGVDVLVLGGTKNGCLGVEAVVLFDPEKAWEFQLRRKRGGHLFSKNRMLAAQMQGYLTDGLWLQTAKQANDNAARLAQGLTAGGATFDHTPQANMIFARFPRRIHAALRADGAEYYLHGPIDGDPDEPISCRLVCDWSLDPAAIDAFLSHF